MNEDQIWILSIVRRSIVGAIVVGIVLIPTIMIGCPRYNVWERGKAGEAELRHAEFNRQIATQEAHAKMESAKLLAAAEVERAKGVAQANQIIGDSLKGNDAYLRYLWIQSLGTGSHEVIYVPTEANLPILEASRLKK